MARAGGRLSASVGRGDRPEPDPRGRAGDRAPRVGFNALPSVDFVLFLNHDLAATTWRHSDSPRGLQRQVSGPHVPISVFMDEYNTMQIQFGIIKRIVHLMDGSRNVKGRHRKKTILWRGWGVRTGGYDVSA
jgi:hypothetical protein